MNLNENNIKNAIQLFEMEYHEKPTTDQLTRFLEVIEGLLEKEASVLISRFGLDDGNPKDVEEVAKQYGITKKRVVQLEEKALLNLRHPTRRKYIFNK